MYACSSMVNGNRAVQNQIQDNLYGLTTLQQIQKNHGDLNSLNMLQDIRGDQWYILSTGQENHCISPYHMNHWDVVLSSHCSLFACLSEQPKMVCSISN